jgi:formylglycine-generating enzyme required for sulfatase activity
MVMKSTTGASQGEAALAVSGGSYSGGDIPNSNLTFAFTDAASNGNTVTSFFAGLPKDIYITVYEPGANDPIPASSIECTVELKSGARTFSTPGCTTVGNSKKITLPSTLMPDDYRLYVMVAYNGFTYDCSYPLECKEHVTVGMIPVTGATITGSVSDSAVFIAGRTVTISNLYVSDHEVTQAEFLDVMGTNPSNFKDDAASGETQANRPVDNISWYAAIAYCNKVSIMEGLTPCYSVDGITDWASLAYSSIPISKNDTWNAITCDFTKNGYRLPTEAEWEYIARGGNGLTGTQTKYSGSDTVDYVAWYKGYSGETKTHEVKTKNANSLGIYDMSGNVWEWCWDWNVSSITGDTPATGASSGSKRVLRGGSWYTAASSCAVSGRGGYMGPSGTNDTYGFRVVRTR